MNLLLSTSGITGMSNNGYAIKTYTVRQQRLILNSIAQGRPGSTSNLHNGWIQLSAGPLDQLSISTLVWLLPLR